LNAVRARAIDVAVSLLILFAPFWMSAIGAYTELATRIAAPLAWYDATNGEIGDICNGQQGSYAANGTTYTIQLEFSNAANNCVLPPPASPAWWPAIQVILQ